MLQDSCILMLSDRKGFGSVSRLKDQNKDVELKKEEEEGSLTSCCSLSPSPTTEMRSTEINLS